MKKLGTILVAAVGVLSVVACATPAETGDAPETTLDGLDPAVAQTSTPDNWLVTANKPTIYNVYEIQDTTTVFTNNSAVANTHRAGGCVVRRDGPTTCTNDASCGSSATLGYRYCMQADGDTAKRCYAKAEGGNNAALYCQQGVLVSLGAGASTTMTISSTMQVGAPYSITYHNLSVISAAGNCTSGTCFECGSASDDPTKCKRTLSAGTTIKPCGYQNTPMCP